MRIRALSTHGEETVVGSHYIYHLLDHINKRLVADVMVILTVGTIASKVAAIPLQSQRLPFTFFPSSFLSFSSGLGYFERLFK